MEPEERVFPVAGDGFVELLVVVVLELGFGALPHRACGVYLLGSAGLDGFLLLGVPLALVVREEDGEGDVVGVFLDDLRETPAIGVLCALIVEVDKDGSSGALAGFGAGDFLDVESGLAVAGPLKCLALRQPCARGPGPCRRP